MTKGVPTFLSVEHAFGKSVVALEARKHKEKSCFESTEEMGTLLSHHWLIGVVITSAIIIAKVITIPTSNWTVTFLFPPCIHISSNSPSVFLLRTPAGLPHALADTPNSEHFCLLFPSLIPVKIVLNSLNLGTAGFGGSGHQIPVRARISHPSRPTPGPKQPSIQWTPDHSGE
jgi:hypothetical protein